VMEVKPILHILSFELESLTLFLLALLLNVVP